MSSPLEHGSVVPSIMTSILAGSAVEHAREQNGVKQALWQIRLTKVHMQQPRSSSNDRPKFHPSGASMRS